MNYTLDTDAIRKRFAEAIVGIRADGSMAVLVETIASNWFDIVDGGTYNEPMVRDLFTALIRPGDRVEARETEEYDWDSATFNGFSGNTDVPFNVTVADCIMYVADIRPLPEPVAEPSTCSECGDKLVKCVDVAAEIVSYYCPSCQRKNNLMTRLAAAERELAAIRAEMKGTQ